MALEIKAETCGGLYLVVPSGRLDTETSGDFELHMHDAMNEGARHVVIDLHGISYVSSAGLRVLLMLAKKLDAGESSLRLSGLGEHVRQVFDISGFTQLFKIFGSLESALVGHPAAGVDDDTLKAKAAELAPTRAGGSDNLADAAARLLGVTGGSPAATPSRPPPSRSEAPTVPLRTPEQPGFFVRLWRRLFGR